VPLGSLNLITGANGSGKSSLYRALRLLAEAAQGAIVSSLAREGGLSSTLWAGPEDISRAMKKRLVEKASIRSQVWVVSHPRMIAALKETKDRNAITLTKELGETVRGSGPARRAAVETAGALSRPLAPKKPVLAQPAI
jgi:predicted ATPase